MVLSWNPWGSVGVRLLCIPSHRIGFLFPLPNPSFTKEYFILFDGKPWWFLSANVKFCFLLFPYNIGFALQEVWSNSVSLRSEIIALTTEAMRWNFGGSLRAGSSSHHGLCLWPPWRKPSVPLRKGFGSMRPPPASRLPPSCRVPTSSEGMNLLR